MFKKCFLLVGVFLLFLTLSPESKSYPQIQNYKKKPKIIFDGQKPQAIQKNEWLKSAFEIQTESQEEVQLQLTPHQKLTLFENSVLRVSEVDENSDTGEVLILKKGRVRLRSEAVIKEDKLVRLKTDFFDLRPPANLDAFVAIDWSVPQVLIQVIRGEWPLAFFAYEKQITLKSGQQVIFTGVLNEEKSALVYDSLLKGQKIPKGKLGEIQPYDTQVFFSIEKKQAEQVEAARQRQIKLKEKQLQAQKALEAQYLCHEPFGQKDQCAWRLEQGRCYRQRCNVNGQWGDRAERPILDTAWSREHCRTDFKVDECDY